MPKFLVNYRIHGTATDYIEAESLAAAEAQVEAKVNDESGEHFLDLEEADDVDYTIAELIPVIRDGQRISTTYVRETDEVVS